MVNNLRPREVKVIRATTDIGEKDILRVAAYCRISTSSDDQANSFMAQVKYYNDFIRFTDGMELVDIYADEGITGTSTCKREEFKRMMKDSRLGKIDRIYVKSVTRFARNSLDCIENIRILKENGTSVFFENDGIDTEKMNSEMILYIKSAFAQSESLAASRRVSTACRMRMENGSFVTTCAPFGYKLINKKLVVSPKEAEIVRRIYDLYLSGLGINKIISELNETEKDYAPWRRKRVAYILKNEKYTGDSLWQKSFTPAVLPLKQIRNKGAADKFYVENTHEAIVDKITFREVQKLFEKKTEKLKDKLLPKSLPYTRILYCGNCGNSYKSKNNTSPRRWVCSLSGTGGRYCNTASLTETEIEKTFVNFYNRLKQNESTILQKAVTQITVLKKRLTCDCDSISEIDRELASLADENSIYIRFMERGNVDEVTFREQTAIVNKRINELRSRRQKILHEDDEESCIELLRKTREQLNEMPSAILWFDRSIFNALIERIFVISKSALVFELKCGMKFKENIVWD